MQPKHSHLIGPEMIPKGIVTLVGNTCIETDLDKIPAFCLTYEPGKRNDMVIRVGIAEGFVNRIV